MRIPGTARRGLTGASETQAFRTAALARRADADSTSSTARRRNVASAAVRNACLEPFSVRLHKERARRQYEPIRRARSDAVQAAEKGSKCLGMEQGYLSESSVSHPAYFPDESSNTIINGRFWSVACITIHLPASLMKPVFCTPISHALLAVSALVLW